MKKRVGNRKWKERKRRMRRESHIEGERHECVKRREKTRKKKELF